MAWYTPAPAAPRLAGEAVTAWTADAGGEHTLVPDGCVDVLWMSTGRAVVCGPETSGWSFALPAGTSAVGVRLRPGRAAAVLGLDTPGALNRRVDLADVVGDRLARQTLERLDAAAPTARLGVLQNAVAAAVGRASPQSSSGPSARSADLVADALTAEPGMPVGALARAAGLSERQLHRRCIAAFGYGPATLRRILRLQRFLHLAQHPGATVDLAVLAAMAGYSDQPHLARESRALAGVPPSILVGMDTATGAANRVTGLGGT
ncbi:helix-turn-helix domain-containing protein [Nocardiopsis coralliicola]